MNKDVVFLNYEFWTLLTYSLRVIVHICTACTTTVTNPKLNNNFSPGYWTPVIARKYQRK